MVRLVFAAVFAVALSACSCGSAPPAPPLTQDGGAGALDGGAAPGPDGGADGGVHRGIDAGTDAGTGRGTDGGTRGTDGGSDAGTGSDAGSPIGTRGPDGCLLGLSAIAISPSGSTVEVDPTSPTPIAFQATGTFGTATADITQDLTWSVTRNDDTAPGTISAGLYLPAAGAGGEVTIHATDGCQAGAAQLALHLDATFQDPGTGTTTRFDGPVVTDASSVPTFVYPNDQTRFPRNLFKVLFQWQKNGNDFFRLTFEGPYSKVVVYTDGDDPACAGASGAGCWQADEATWTAIAGSNAGELTQVALDGVTSGDTNVYRASIQLGFSRRDVRGAIFYWSTTAAGIRRASLFDDEPEDYVVAKPSPTTLSDGSTVKCVACHTVSRSGAQIFGGTQTSSTNGEFVYDVTTTAPPDVVLTNQISTNNKGFGTFSPDDTRVVATTGSTLAEFDARSGERLYDLPPSAATNPDWSPRGDVIAYSDKGGDSPSGADLMLLDYLGGDNWSDYPRMLVPSDGLTNLFPSFSPDGQYVVYARGKGGHGDKTLDLYLVSVEGGAPVQLFQADHAINNDPSLTSGTFENNQPTWAPSGDLLWVAFNSARPYGVLTTAGESQQIWVAAIDPAKLGTGEDPSYPAFRFPVQSLSENNHRAFWSEDIRFPVDAGTPDPVPDAGSPDAGAPDAGTPDAGTPDAGVCLGLHQACDQTVGNCCFGLVCDLPFDGGSQTECREVIN